MPRDIEDLTSVNKELIQAIRGLIEQERQKGVNELAKDQRIGLGPLGNVNVGPGLPNAGGLAGAENPFWQSAGAGVQDFSSSALKSFISGTGNAMGGVGGQVANMAGAALTGNPAAVGAAAGNAAAFVLKESIAPYRAAINTFESALQEGPFEDEAFATKRSVMASRVARDKANLESPINQAVELSRGGIDHYMDWVKQSAQVIRRETGEMEAFTSVEHETAQRLQNFFAPLAQGGQRPDQKQYFQMGQYFHTIAQFNFENRKMSEEVASQIMMRPGNSQPAR